MRIVFGLMTTNSGCYIIPIRVLIKERVASVFRHFLFIMWRLSFENFSYLPQEFCWRVMLMTHLWLVRKVKFNKHNFTFIISLFYSKTLRRIFFRKYLNSSVTNTFLISVSHSIFRILNDHNTRACLQEVVSYRFNKTFEIYF